MTTRHTARGCARLEFTDVDNIPCSLQESSLATEPAIWLGCNDPNPTTLLQGDGWVCLPMPDDVSCTTRMHLSREQVKDLLPHLQRFVEEGKL